MLMLHQTGNRLLVVVLWSVAGRTSRFFFSYATHLLIVPDADSLSCYRVIIFLNLCPLILNRPTRELLKVTVTVYKLAAASCFFSPVSEDADAFSGHTPTDRCQTLAVVAS